MFINLVTKVDDEKVYMKMI